MVRQGYILEQIADMDNLRAADRNAQRGKTSKNKSIQAHNKNAETNLLLLREMILTLNFPEQDYKAMHIISDAGKVRNIVKQDYFPWRILHHAIIQIIEPRMNNSLITDTSACIKGRGVHFGVRRMQMFLRRYPEYKWFVKTDFKKFYESIPHEALKNSFRTRFKDERLIELIDKTILNYRCDASVIDGLRKEIELRKTNNLLNDASNINLSSRRGIPIGGYPSQPFGNFVLSDIDHWIKEEKRVKCMHRYCDDTVMLAKTKSEAIHLLKAYDDKCLDIGLVIKHTGFISPIHSNGKGRMIDFLGYQFDNDKTLMRKSIKKDFARKASRIKSKKRRKEVLAAYWGWSKHADCKHLWSKITNNYMGFEKLGIKPNNVTKDGKRFFDCERVGILEIINVPITVLDFEPGVKTKYGDNTYWVKIDINGVEKKFATSSYSLIDTLEQARKLEETSEKPVFPVEDVTIRRKSLGDGKLSYFFN